MSELPHLLILEDEPWLASQLPLLLGQQGYRTTVVLDGLDGLAALDQQNFDLCITNVVLQHLGGLEFARRMKERPDAPPLMFYTHCKGLKDEVLNSGLAEDYVLKNESLAEFYRRIALVLERFTHRREDTRKPPGRT